MDGKRGTMFATKSAVHSATLRYISNLIRIVSSIISKDSYLERVKAIRKSVYLNLIVSKNSLQIVFQIVRESPGYRLEKRP